MAIAQRLAGSDQLGIVFQAGQALPCLQYTPTQVAEKQIAPDRRFRLGGLVEAGSVRKEGQEVRFTVTDTHKTVAVLYRGLLPDLFREGQGVVAEGALTPDGVFVAREVLAPADLETRFALTGGQLHHGELALDQLLVMRPGPSAARYRTVVPGLYLGGSGSHPGGGVRPTAGLLAAEAVVGS